MADYPIKEEYLRDVKSKEEMADVAEKMMKLMQHEQFMGVQKAIWSGEDIIWLARDVFRFFVQKVGKVDGTDYTDTALAEEALAAARAFDAVLAVQPGAGPKPLEGLDD
jgi:hypothetical protein